jgi:hypothetical protein
MKKSNSTQHPLIRSLSQSQEEGKDKNLFKLINSFLEKKNNGETAASSQQNPFILHKESIDQTVYKNSKISVIKEFKEYENEVDIRGFFIFPLIKRKH